MHRIFWKILLSFWLALLFTGAGTAICVTLYQDAKIRYFALDTGDHPANITTPIARTLAIGGKELMFQLVKPAHVSKEFAAGGPPFPYIVDQKGQDLYQRIVDKKALLEAQKITEKNTSSEGVQKVTTPAGEIYWVYMTRTIPPFPHNIIFMLFDLPLFLLIIALLASLLFSNWLARSIARPIEVLRDNLKAVSKGNFDIDVSKALGNRHDEFADLGADTDAMAVQLKQLLESQRRLLHDVSHDLRSPLARLQLAIGLMRQKPETTEQMLIRIEQECHRLDSLVGEVLTLARMEAGVPQPREDYIDLIELLKSLVDDAQFEARESGSQVSLTVEPKLEDGIIIQSRGELLLRAFDNLIRNALQHAGRGCHIELTVSLPTPKSLIIDVADDGPGIAENDLASIFNPFFRSNNNPGDGLGLAITKRAIEAHGGKVSALNRPVGGLCMHIELPYNADFNTDDADKNRD